MAASSSEKTSQLDAGLPSPSPAVSKQASQLVGHLDSEWVVNNLTSRPPRSMKAALDAALQNSSGASSGTESASEEDYDVLKQDPLALVQDERARGVSSRTKPSPLGEQEENSSAARSRPGPMRIKSIPITLSKLNEKGKYILTADDKDVREILRLGLERENNPMAANKRRRKFSDLVFTRQFTAFDRQNASRASNFEGFFTLFWLGTAIYMLQIAAENWRQHGNILGTNEIMSMMFHRDVMVLGLSDGVLCASTGFGWALQRLIVKGYLSWNRSGFVIQSLWEILYLIMLLGWTLFREWPWTHTIFFVLHGLVMLMKQHSYSYYNGHLSESYKMRSVLEQKLKYLERIAPAQSPSAITPKTESWSTSYLNLDPDVSDIPQRRKQEHDGSANLSKVAAALESGEPLDLDQIQMFERIIKWEINALTQDLKGKGDGKNAYPANLTISNHYEFIVLPTLVYELSYPRSDSIDWYYVAEKTAATFGVLGIMILVSQAFIYPVVVKTIAMKHAGLSLQNRLTLFPGILSDLIFPFMMEYMMAWYVIWECILNLLAEVTYFADRGFYADWWNSVSWDQFARDWNRPVHNFLLRHVYHSSISSMKVNKYTATLITFFLSACVHELVMWCLFKKLRGYLLVLQMMQLPLVQLSRSKLLKGRATLGNLIFWIGIFTGPSLLCSLYLII